MLARICAVADSSDHRTGTLCSAFRFLIILSDHANGHGAPRCEGRYWPDCPITGMN